MPDDADHSEQPFFRGRGHRGYRGFRGFRRRRGRRLRPSRMLRVLPSLFTLGNLLCGFASIFYASRYPGREEALAIAALLVFFGMVLDALDGRVARLTGQTSQMGEQLDSMADMVTFGAAPAFMVIQLVEIGVPFFHGGHTRWDHAFERFVLVVAGVYVACTALRLARFNAELEQPGEADHMGFKGLPSPAAAGTVCSLVLLHQKFLGRQPDGDHLSFIYDGAKLTAVGMVFIALLAAVAMVSTMRYVHVMNRYLRDRAPIHYIGAAVFVLIPLITLPQVTLSIIFVGYAISGPLILLMRRGREQRAFPASPPTVEPKAQAPPGQPQPTLRIRHR